MKRVLVLQGGGALGSYQAGVFEALAGAGVEPHWVAVNSIGAVNAALIAGNPPDRRVEALKTFWTLVSDGPQVGSAARDGPLRELAGELNAANAAFFGVSGFFTPRFPPPPFQPPGGPEAISFYDTAPLRSTLERLVDFDRINAAEMRFSVGAVNIRTGNFAYFDNGAQKIGPEHIMASGALPPGLPPVEIDGEAYWDGGLVSNTPLEYVLEEDASEDLLIFQVDLFPARGPMPKTLLEAAEREKDIRYSSRTRLNTDQALKHHRTKRLALQLIDQLPADLAASDAAAELRALAMEHALTVVQLIYRRRPYEGTLKDFEFSRATMQTHWDSGVRAVRQTLERRAEILEAPRRQGCAVFDLCGPAEGGEP